MIQASQVSKTLPDIVQGLHVHHLPMPKEDPQIKPIRVNKFRNVFTEVSQHKAVGPEDDHVAYVLFISLQVPFDKFSAGDHHVYPHWILRRG